MLSEGRYVACCPSEIGETVRGTNAAVVAAARRQKRHDPTVATVAVAVAAAGA
jgi:hypothetical protein